MMEPEMAKKVLGGAVGALELAVDAARHVAWYVSHQVNPRPKDAETPRD
jgi:hypothetical protein